MKNSTDTNLPLELGEMMRQGYGYIIQNASKIIAIITVLVATLVTFTDVAFSDLTGVSFTSTLAVMLIASYLMYFSLEDAGEKYGEESEEYKSVLLRYSEARKGVAPSSIPALREFCARYSSDEVVYRKETFLSERGYSIAELEEWRRGAPFPKKARRVFQNAEKIKPIKLTPAVLLSQERGSRKSELENPERAKFLGMILRLIPTTLCTFFTASVILTTKNNLTASSVIEGILKLSTLPIIGFKGYQRGYYYARDEKSVWIETKARLIEAFLESEKANSAA